MATIVPSFSEDGSMLIISAPNMPSIEVPLAEVTHRPPVLRLRLWEDSVEVYEPDPAISDWFSKVIGEQQIKFVRMTDKFIRKTDKKYIEGGQTGLSDEFPFLMVSEHSLAELNTRLSLSPQKQSNNSISIEAFRPNIIISGCGPHQEDKMEAVITSSGLRLQAVKLCSRCSVPNVDPKKGVMDTSVKISKVLKSYRTGKHLRLKTAWSDKLFFGVYLDHQSIGEGMVSVGEKLDIVW